MQSKCVNVFSLWGACSPLGQFQPVDSDNGLKMIFFPGCVNCEDGPPELAKKQRRQETKNQRNKNAKTQKNKEARKKEARKQRRQKNEETKKQKKQEKRRPETKKQ